MGDDKQTTKEETLYCSFCGKSQHEVRKLIVGPTVFICEECVELCTVIIIDDIPDFLGDKVAHQRENVQLRVQLTNAQKVISSHIIAKISELAPFQAVCDGIQTILKPPPLTVTHLEKAADVPIDSDH